MPCWKREIRKEKKCLEQEASDKLQDSCNYSVVSAKQREANFRVAAKETEQQAMRQTQLPLPERHCGDA